MEPQFDDPAAGKTVAVFGDVSRFVVRMTPVQFERDDSAYFTSFMSVYRFATYLRLRPAGPRGRQEAGDGCLSLIPTLKLARRAATPSAAGLFSP